MDFDGFKEKGRNWEEVIEKLENNGLKNEREIFGVLKTSRQKVC